MNHHRLQATAVVDEYGAAGEVQIVLGHAHDATGRSDDRRACGPAGFLKVLDAQRLAYADFRGNRQYSRLAIWRSMIASRYS